MSKKSKDPKKQLAKASRQIRVKPLVVAYNNARRMENHEALVAKKETMRKALREKLELDPPSIVKE